MFEEGNADDSVIGGDSDDIGDLGDSDKEGQEVDIHNDGLHLRTVLEGSNEAIGKDANNINPFHGEEFGNYGTQSGIGQQQQRSVNGAPKDWFPPGPPSSFCGYEPKTDLGAPGVELLGHFTPGLAKVVPCDEARNWVIGRWKFYYNGWMPDEFDHQTYVRDDASQLNLKPESRHGL